jgi:hypothetical protein
MKPTPKASISNFAILQLLVEESPLHRSHSNCRAKRANRRKTADFAGRVLEMAQWNDVRLWTALSGGGRPGASLARKLIGR